MKQRRKVSIIAGASLIFSLAASALQHFRRADVQNVLEGGLRTKLIDTMKQQRTRRQGKD